MDITTAPATEIVARGWQGFQLNRAVRIHDGALVADVYAGGSALAQKFMGDKDGKPLLLATEPGPAQGTPAGFGQDALMAILNKPTPEGMTVFQYLDQELGKLAKASLP